MKTLVMTAAAAMMFVGCESKTSAPVAGTTTTTTPVVEVTAPAVSTQVSPTVAAPVAQQPAETTDVAPSVGGNGSATGTNSVTGTSTTTSGK